MEEKLYHEITVIGKGAFKKIAPDAKIYVVTGNKETFNRIKELIENSGIGKGVTIKKKSKKKYNAWKAKQSDT